ncbi:putative tubulin polyglutamylase ttll2 [Geranomyces variabilis]|uniref:Tubulin polyglutamylase ttll2 n=1 Tax=Geranomyces variabilis TaxID=109894 RepID=A0AAD5TFW2_9FUNG|nr:putative tubulin polyglutamylase ttll2 [Geranomyces variabilis]
MAAAAAFADNLAAGDSHLHRYYVMAETGPQAVREVLEAKGWLPYVEGESPYWNLWWKGSRFRKSDYESCTPWQRLNHFPKTSALTRKDSLYRLLRTMRGIYGGRMYDFVPETFALPNDYVKFVNVAVLQRYIANPLLISGYKFDMRCYVVVRSYNPLVIYLNTEGLARFATVPYTTTSNDVYAHLTNTSINKHSPWLEDEKDEIGSGCRWTFARLRVWFESMGMDYERVWRRIQGTIIATLLPVAAEVPAVPVGCFELYGFDILLDDAMKPWLLEVNFGPALSLGTDVDDEVKKPLISDILELVGITDGDVALAEACVAKPKTRCRSAPETHHSPPSRPPSASTTTSTRRKKPPAAQPTSRANVGRLTRIFPFDATTAQLSSSASGDVPLTVGKPALKKIVQQVKKSLLV